jgi:hypothetical protein
MQLRAIGASVQLVSWVATAVLLLLAAVRCVPHDPVPVAHAQEAIELPADGASVTLPVHVVAHVGEPGQRVRLVLRWQNSTELQRTSEVMADHGSGLIIANLDWEHGTRPNLPSSQTATLQIFDEAGRAVARREVTVLGPGNPEVREVLLYFATGDKITPVTRRIARTPRIATATLDELLWGPAPGDSPGLTTALPTAKDVLEYPSRRTDWGARVQLRQVRIVDGVATANFSRELGAYGGGSLRVGLIDQQITRTLEQFPDVHEVRIAIEGESRGVLEP